MIVDVDYLAERVSTLERTVCDLRDRSAALVGLTFDALGMLRELAPTRAAKIFAEINEAVAQARADKDLQRQKVACIHAAWFLAATFPGNDDADDAADAAQHGAVNDAYPAADVPSFGVGWSAGTLGRHAAHGS